MKADDSEPGPFPPHKGWETRNREEAQEQGEEVRRKVGAAGGQGYRETELCSYVILRQITSALQQCPLHLLEVRAHIQLPGPLHTKTQHSQNMTDILRQICSSQTFPYRQIATLSKQLIRSKTWRPSLLLLFLSFSHHIHQQVHQVLPSKIDPESDQFLLSPRIQRCSGPPATAWAPEQHSN